MKYLPLLLLPLLTGCGAILTDSNYDCSKRPANISEQLSYDHRCLTVAQNRELARLRNLKYGRVKTSYRVVRIGNTVHVY